MSRIEEHLGGVGVTLPKLPTPIATYVPAKSAGHLVFTAGQISAIEGRAYKGKLGATLSIENGRAATRACVINCLAALKSVIGSLDHLKQIVAVHGLINSTQEFDGQALVMNGASGFLVGVLETLENTFAPLWELPACLWDLQPRSTSSRRWSSLNALRRDCSDVQVKEAKYCLSTGGPYA
jgi:enamine deaminase RidA (YjgF/YER057c/UK114 family)